MYFDKIGKNHRINECHLRGGRVGYIVYEAMSNTLFIPAFPGRVFNTISAAEKAVAEKEGRMS